MNFKIIVKLSWCQSGATRGEGFGKLPIQVLLTQDYPRGKMRFSMLGLSLNIICASEQYVEVTAWDRGTFDRCVLARLPRTQIVSGYCMHMRIEAIFKMVPIA